MINKQSKKEMAIERAVQILCVVITIAGCLLFASCEVEPCYEAEYDANGDLVRYIEYTCPSDVYNLELSSVKAVSLSGQYQNYETLVDGVVYERDFDAYWEFTPNAVRWQKGVEVNGETVITTYNQVAISRYEDNILYLLSGSIEIPYEFTVEDNGDITVIHMSGDYVITYKLSN